MKTTQAKKLAREQAERAHEALIGLSHWIHANPELGYAGASWPCGWVAEWLEKAGFEVEIAASAGWRPPSLARIGPGPLNVALLVEYDALPEVGHACGHNVIAAASVGAAVGLAPRGRRAWAARDGAGHTGRGGRRRQAAPARRGRRSRASTRR